MAVEHYRTYFKSQKKTLGRRTVTSYSLATGALHGRVACVHYHHDHFPGNSFFLGKFKSSNETRVFTQKLRHDSTPLPAARFILVPLVLSIFPFPYFN